MCTFVVGQTRQLIKVVTKMPGDILAIRIESLARVEAVEACINIFIPRCDVNFHL